MVDRQNYHVQLLVVNATWHTFHAHLQAKDCHNQWTKDTGERPSDNDVSASGSDEDD